MAAAQRSDDALAKAARKRTTENTPVHSFTSLLADLAAIYANHIQPADDMPAFTMTTTPTPLRAASLRITRRLSPPRPDVVSTQTRSDHKIPVQRPTRQHNRGNFKLEHRAAVWRVPADEPKEYISPAARPESSRGQVQRHHTQWAENDCGVTAFTPRKNEIFPNVSAVAFSDHWTSTPRVSVSKATAPVANTCPTPAACALLVVTGTPNNRRVAGSYGRLKCSIAVWLELVDLALGRAGVGGDFDLRLAEFTVDVAAPPLGRRPDVVVDFAQRLRDAVRDFAGDRENVDIDVAMLATGYSGSSSGSAGPAAGRGLRRSGRRLGGRRLVGPVGGLGAQLLAVIAVSASLARTDYVTVRRDNDTIDHGRL